MCRQRWPVSRSDHYHRVMWCSGAVSSRTRRTRVPPSGRQHWTRSGSPTAISAVAAANASDRAGRPERCVNRAGFSGWPGWGRGRSVRPGQCQHLRALSFGESAPDSVGLMHLQRVRPASGHGRALEAHRLGLRLAPRACRTAFALRMEEERTRHPATGSVQLPVPKISVRAGKAPGVRHVDPLCGDHTCGDQLLIGPTVPGIRARSASRHNPPRTFLGQPRQSVGEPCRGRIRADPGAVDDQTLDRFSSRDKSLIMNIVDLDPGVLKIVCGARVTIRGSVACGVPHSARDVPESTGQWRIVGVRLLSAVSAGFVARSCPNHPLWGPYRRPADAQGSSGPAVATTHLTSTPAVGGIT